MQNHYEILGVNSSASLDEIRRAYRVLARRYHPDVNPGRNSEERFKLIANAYAVLSESDKRRQFDIELERVQFGKKKQNTYQQPTSNQGPDRARRRYAEAAQRATQARGNQQTTTRAAVTESQPQLAQTFKKVMKASSRGFRALTKDLFSTGSPTSHSSASTNRPGTKVSIIEVSVTIRDAILGTKKTIEIPEPEGSRKVSIRVPPGIRTGNMLRMRSRSEHDEDLICIFRVAHHPFLSLQPKGLIIEIPITVHEAISGASITVPTLEEPIVLKIPPGTQSGTEFRVRERGILQNESRGDLFYRALVHVPTCYQAVGISTKSAELDQYYEASVRQDFPKTLLDE